MEVKIYKAGLQEPWELRKHRRHRPVITRLRRAGTVTFDDLERPLSECHVTVTKKPRKARRKA